jgi:serine/threonine protein kinase
MFATHRPWETVPFLLRNKSSGPTDLHDRAPANGAPIGFESAGVPSHALGNSHASGKPDPLRSIGAQWVGKTLRGTYRILELLSQGGMGLVFAAEHLRLNRRVAVKLIATHLNTDPRAFARFRSEAEIISQLQHPHIVQVLDFDIAESGQPYLVMELLHGESLADRLDREGTIRLPEVSRISGQAAAALAEAHRAGIIHRDLKPANIFLVNVPNQSPFVKLLDFGISKRTGFTCGLTGQCDVLGTPEYMPPEQASGNSRTVDHRADQYALAAIAYEMLTGRAPFSADNVMEVLRQVIHEPPPSVLHAGPRLPSQLDAVLRRALAKDPAQRFETVIDFAAALAEATNGTTRDLPRVRTAPEQDVPLASVRPGSRTSTAPTRPSQQPFDIAMDSTQLDPAKQVEVYLSAARVALASTNYRRASQLAEAACAVVDTTGHSTARQALHRASVLLNRIFLTRLGAPERRLLVRHLPRHVSPEQMTILSRLDSQTTVGELLDLSSLPRPQTLRLLVDLVDRGVLQVA